MSQTCFNACLIISEAIVAYVSAFTKILVRINVILIFSHCDRVGKGELPSLNGGFQLLLGPHTFIHNGCESCLLSWCRSNSQGPSEHIIGGEEAEVLFSATIAQILEGPVGPP